MGIHSCQHIGRSGISRATKAMISDSRRRELGTPSHNLGNEGFPRYLRMPDLMRQLGVSRSTIYLLISRGILPRPIKLGLRVAVWLQSDVEASIALARGRKSELRASRKGSAWQKDGEP